MFIPAEIAQTEPLLDMDEDLAELELQAAQAPSVQLLINMAEEYFNRAYLQRALFTCGSLTKMAPEDAEGWKLLANTQIDMGLDSEAKSSLQCLLSIPGIDITDAAWAESMIYEVASRLGDSPQQKLPPIGDTFSGAPATAAAPVPVPMPMPTPEAAYDPSLQIDPLSALSLMSTVQNTPTGPISKPPPTPRAPSNNAIGGVLEQQGIITQIATKDSGQLESVRLLLEKDPNNVELLDWYAFALYSSERLEEAIEVYERIINDFEKSENAYYYIGSAYLKIPDLKKAFHYFSLLKQEFPGSHLNQKVADKKLKLKALTK
jgi:tetratricopeptide (TPR) repeat protein